jgi:hypothetical protein
MLSWQTSRLAAAGLTTATGRRHASRASDADGSLSRNPAVTSLRAPLVLFDRCRRVYSTLAECWFVPEDFSWSNGSLSSRTDGPTSWVGPSTQSSTRRSTRVAPQLRVSPP